MTRWQHPKEVLMTPVKTDILRGFPCGSASKESACNVGELGSIPGLERSPGEGKSYPLQYSGLENSMDCIVQGLQKYSEDNVKGRRERARCIQTLRSGPNLAKPPHVQKKIRPHAEISFAPLLHLWQVRLPLPLACAHWGGFPGRIIVKWLIPSGTREAPQMQTREPLWGPLSQLPSSEDALWGLLFIEVRGLKSWGLHLNQPYQQHPNSPWHQGWIQNLPPAAEWT